MIREEIQGEIQFIHPEHAGTMYVYIFKMCLKHSTKMVLRKKNTHFV